MMTDSGSAAVGRRQQFGALRRSAALFARDLYEWAVLCWWLGVLCTCWTPWVVRATALVRRNVDRQRDLARRYGGIVVPRHYRHRIVTHRRYVGDARELGLQASDRTARGDLWWHLFNPLIGGTIAVLPFALVAEVLWGLALPFLWPSLHDVLDHPWVFGVPVVSQGMANAMAVVSLLLLYPVVRWPAPWAVGVHCRWVSRILITQGPADADGGDADDIDRSRRTVVDLQTAELQRIARDLHDGAQAKVVAIGMGLSRLETLIGQQPDQARALTTDLRQTSVEVLEELRGLVRGIVPPVLADRGLLDAIRAIAAANPVDVVVRGRYDVALPTPVESAVYFAVAECLTNAAKHSSATRIDVDLSRRGDHLTVTVSDNGQGGAVITTGGGLDGLRRRLEAFDGRLRLNSPPGGPTVVALRLPLPQQGPPDDAR